MIYSSTARATAPLHVANPSPKDTLTRSATRSPTASSTRCSTVDRSSRVAVETVVTTGLVHVVGEVTCSGYVDIPTIVRQTHPRHRLQLVRRRASTASPAVSRCRSARSRPTSRRASTVRWRAASGASDPLDAQGAGDQGIMFGFATTETPQYMPLPHLAGPPTRRERLGEVRKSRRTRLPAAGRQDPGHDRLRRRSCRAPSTPWCCRRSTRPASTDARLCRRDRRARDPPDRLESSGLDTDSTRS